MAADNISPQAEARLRHIHVVAGNMLNRLNQLLPDGYKLTLIARHPNIPNAQMVVSDDTDLEAVANALLTAKARE